MFEIAKLCQQSACMDNSRNILLVVKVLLGKNNLCIFYYGSTFEDEINQGPNMLKVVSFNL